MPGGVGAVAEQDDPVAGLELAAAHLQHTAGEFVGDLRRARRLRALASLRVPASRTPLTPARCASAHALDGWLVDVGGGRGDGDVAVVEVGAEPGEGVAVAQLVEGGVFPFGLLAAVDGEFGGARAEEVDGGREDAAGGDLGQLVMVADQDHLGADLAGVGDDAVEVDGGGHAGFVDHDDVAGGERGGLVELEAGERERVDGAPSASSRRRGRRGRRR